MTIFAIILLQLFSFTSDQGIIKNIEINTISNQKHPELIQFDTELIELGEIKRGDIKEFKFDFTNVSKQDLEIEFMSSCECTTLDYPMDVIEPGKGGSIYVTFDSAEKTKSETVDIDIDLVNKDPKTGDPIFIRINYSFILID